MSTDPPTGSLFSTHAVRIEEIINKSIGVFLPTLDPVWRNTIVTSQGVGSAGEFGSSDYKILKVYMGGLTGILEQGGPRTDFTLYGDPSNTALGSKLHLQGLSQVWPSALDGPNQTPYRLGIPMRTMVSNIMFTLGEMQAEATSAFIGQIVAPKMEGFARHIAQQLCNYWYISQNLYYRLARFNGAVATDWTITEDSNTTLALNTTSGDYEVDRFQVGIRVQIYASDGATLRTTPNGDTVWVCTAVDELTGWVRFKSITNDDLSGTWQSAIADEDIIVYAGSKGDAATPHYAVGSGGTATAKYFTGIAGINSWLKTGSDSYDDPNNTIGLDTQHCLLGTESDSSNKIDVRTHPEFKSFIQTLSGEPLTEHYLRKVLRRWHSAKNKYGQTIDCLIASDGVWLAYEAQKIGREYLNRTGRVSSIQNEGSDMSSENDGIRFQMDGRTYTGYTSSYIESGVMYGIKKGGNNWKRYVPPDPRGVKKGANVESWIPFRFVAAALTGTGSNQVPIYSVNSNRTLLTEGVQMPGMLRLQLVPDQPAGMKLTNIAEDRVYSAS